MKKSIAMLLVAIPLVGVIAGCGSYGQKVERDDLQIYYTENVQKSEAKEALALLAKLGWAKKGQQRSIQLCKDGSRYQFRVVVKKGHENNAMTKVSMGAMAFLLSKDVFDNSPVDVHLCDNRFETLSTVPFPKGSRKS